MSRFPLPVRPDGQVVVTGSLAFDQIMVFSGDFKDHILTDKIHTINISFLVSELRKQRGGCAGNIAYTIALLGGAPRIVATAGNDFGAYRAWLDEHGVDTSAIEIHDDVDSACCHITTDQSDNQITGFFVGAMARAADLSLRQRAGERAVIAIVAPDDPDAMLRHSREAREMGLPFVFDPSFQVTAMDGESLRAGAEAAAFLMVNDYELAVFQKKTGTDDESIFDLVERVVVTLGGEGSRILARGEAPIEVPAARISGMVDPTGAGDAYRAGFITGLVNHLSLAECGRLGSVAAAFVVEQHGTQNHAYTIEAFEARYAESFGQAPRLRHTGRAA